jgi:hypothetical protein
VFFTTFFLISPTAKILGLYDTAIYNLQISRLIVVLLLPSSFIIYLFKEKKIKTKLIKQNLKMFVILFSIPFVISITSFIRNDFSLFNLNITVLLNMWTFITFFLFSIFIFSNERISIELKFKIMNHIFLSILFMSSIFALMTYLKIDIFYNIHKNYYNLFLGGYSGEKSLFSMVERYNRVYSIFSGPNQFGFFAVLMYIYFTLSKNMRIISNSTYLITILLELIILFTSQSRTSLLLYSAVGIFIYLNNSLKMKVYLLPVILVFIVGIIPFVPARVIDIFSITNFTEELDSQRLFFWISAINEMFASSSSFMFGFIEKVSLPEEGFHIENGYLQLIAMGGIVAFVMLFYFLVLLKKNYQMYLYDSIKQYALFTIYIVGISELFMGSIFNVKMSMVIGTLFGFYLSLKIGKKSC